MFKQLLVITMTCVSLMQAVDPEKECQKDLKERAKLECRKAVLEKQLQDENIESGDYDSLSYWGKAKHWVLTTVQCPTKEQLAGVSQVCKSQKNRDAAASQGWIRQINEPNISTKKK